ncbi:MAG: HEPN domain-containing protein [Planctomycetota bacterium]|jgi:HEPN domain-containing protein
MAACDEARQLLSAANKDWRALYGMGDPDVFADEIFGFHAQRAVEKALKAWLSLLGVEYPITHDLTLLLSILQENGQKVKALYELIEFNPYAVQYRYEAFEEVGSPLDRTAVTARIGDLLRMIEALIDPAR